MTSPIQSSTSPANAPAAATASAAATGPTKTLGQDAFLKLLMAQLSNQDPLNPVQGTEFVTQLSQFSLVEQSVQQSTSLTNIGTQLQGLSNADATSLVGKTVTVSGSGMAYNGVLATSGNVTLGGSAQSVTVSISDSNGNVVRTMQLGSEPAGALTVNWNGLNDSGQQQAAGNYTLNVTATDANGQPVNVSQNVTGTVTQVNFSQGYPQLTLSTGTVVPISNLISVGSGATPTNP
jgi:flagellar basal-body rod modification protein FlgD